MLANDLYFVCHHDYTGKPRTHERAVAIGLAAGMLAELMVSGHITSDGERLQITSDAPPRDALIHSVLDQLIAEQEHQHTIRTWLQYLSAQSTGQVVRRLEVAGRLRLHTGGWLKKQTIYLPTDPNAAGAPAAVLLVQLHQRRPLDSHRAVLTGLCVATGLTRYLLDGAPPESSDYLQHVIDALPGPVRGLLYHTNAAVAGAALLPR